MKLNLYIVSIFLILASCDNEVSEISRNDNIFINSELTKLPSDTLDINWTGGTLDINWGDGKIHPNKKFSFNYFDDKAGICKISDDTVYISTHQGFWRTNSLNIAICNGIFSVELMEHNCTYSHRYTKLQQKLVVNKSAFKVGDTLTGEIYYQAIYVWDSIRPVVDTTTIYGKFKLKIRNKDFNRDSLTIENNFNKLRVELSNLNADTVKNLRLSNCGLRSLPQELKRFTNLEVLELDNNNFEKSDLLIICELKNLKSISLNNCNIDKFPSSILCLQKLERLDLFNNNILNLPSSLFELTKISQLQLGGNLLTIIPNEIVNLKNLQMLEISGSGKWNNIVKLPPHFFDKLTNLTEFYPPESLPMIEYKDYKGE